MERVDRTFKEWNAIIEALGQGKQTIVIRKYKPSVSNFLLYPTFSYTIRENYLDMFQEKYHEFVKQNSIPNEEKNKIKIKYYARCEEIINKISTRSGSLSKYSIWSKDHIKSYLGKEKAYVWILRIYKLDKPYMATKSRGMLYGKIRPIELTEIEPVISNDEFSKIVNKIK